MIGFLDDVSAAFLHGGAGKRADPTHDYTGGHAFGVRVDALPGPDRFHPVMLGEQASRTQSRLAFVHVVAEGESGNEIRGAGG